MKQTPKRKCEGFKQNAVLFKQFILSILLIVFTTNLPGQTTNDSVPDEKIKTGWNFGFLPVVSYNSDLGLQYGALTNIYQYGDGSIYPQYYHSIYAEVSRYTKGSGIYRLFYDSKHLIPNMRTIFDVSYLPDEALDFFGFNGYQSVYNTSWADDTDPNYKTRMFYKHKRNIFRAKFDFQGKTGVKNLNWAAGLNLMNVEIAPVDIEKLNEGKEEEDRLPNVPTLYEHYLNWGLISTDEAKGGFFTSLKAGVVYDSRDNEPNPMSGLWSEAVVFQSFSTDFTFTKIALTHRQYFPIIENDLSFAYRLGYQGIIAGDAPFYMLPYMVYSYLPSSTNDGLGGSKTVRGIVRNRVVGEGVAFGNFELRYKFTRFNFINQNFYLALSPFMDFGRVLIERDIDYTKIPDDVNTNQYFNTGNETDKIHLTYGMGLHIAMNQNFIIAVDAGFPINEQDGSMGLYIGMNFLF